MFRAVPLLYQRRPISLNIRAGGNSDPGCESIIKLYILNRQIWNGRPDERKTLRPRCSDFRRASVSPPAAAHASPTTFYAEEPMGLSVIHLICKDFIAGSIGENDWNRPAGDAAFPNPEKEQMEWIVGSLSDHKYSAYIRYPWA